MKKTAKKSLSLLLAVSALCILFAFQASAISTTCQECGGSNIDYISLGNVGEPNAPVYHHEVYCYNCGCSTDEEDCETCHAVFNCTLDGYCECGQQINRTTHIWGYYNTSPATHIATCTIDGCESFTFESHTFVNGECIYCHYPNN